MDVNKRQYQHCISLGKHCRTAHQLRRITNSATAYYFDWLRTPHDGLMRILRDGFGASFQRGNLEIRDEGTLIVDAWSGIGYNHNFRKIQGTNLIDVNAVNFQYEEQKAKMDFLASRLEVCIQSDSILFVRHDKGCEASVRELYGELEFMAGQNAVDLLIVTPPDQELRVDHPHIFVERRDLLPSGKADWKGEDEIWDGIMSEYWTS